MQIQAGFRLFGITFRYFTREGNVAEGRPERRGVICEILERNPESIEFHDVLAEGEAVCDSRTPFVKAEGRSRALTKAVHAAFPGDTYRAMRADIWAGYHGRKGSKIDAARAYSRCMARLARRPVARGPVRA